MMVKLLFGITIKHKQTEQHNNVLDVGEEARKIFLQAF